MIRRPSRPPSAAALVLGSFALTAGILAALHARDRAVPVAAGQKAATLAAPGARW